MIGLRTAQKYQIEYSKRIMYGFKSQKAVYDIFSEFNLIDNENICEYDSDYEILRSNLIRFRHDFTNKTKCYQERIGFITERMELLQISESEFIDCIDSLINLSDQNNEFILVRWF